MTGVHVHMLSYIITHYLLFLFVITYLIMDCNVQYTSHLLRPVKLIFSYFTKLKRKIAGNNSVIHDFATLISLSMSGIIYETFTIIGGTDVYHVNSSVAETVLYNDPTILKYRIAGNIGGELNFGGLADCEQTAKLKSANFYSRVIT